ncbi:hypothetical protein LUQ84_001036 [Hamiltosporidium tvaerminnensis]|nr:hypothetical protein LUQ84_001036 [Hamiltosporidium tvaerminnensis]
MTTPYSAIPEGNRLMALRTIFDSVTADPKEWPRCFCSTDKVERMPRNGGQSFTGTIMRNSAARNSKC